MNILLLGGCGQVGWKLGAALAPLGRILAPSSAEADLENPDSLRRLVSEYRPEVIVNAAAHTAVDRAEAEAERAWRCNAEAPALLAEAATHLGAWLVHYSTDYVFDGTKDSPYTEEDTPNPLNVYGRSKLAGDEAIRQSGCRHLVFRTSWVFSDRGGNFARTMLELAKKKKKLAVVADQIGAPTAAELLAAGTALALRRALNDTDLSGLYNLSAAGETSWHGFARYLIREAGQRGWPLLARPEDIAALSTAEYPRPARRPLNSRLDVHKFEQCFGLTMPHWSYHADRVLTLWSEAR